MKTQSRQRSSLFALALTVPALCLSPSVTAQQMTTAMPLPVILHVPSLVDSIDEVAGQRVQIRNARVLEVIEPRTILVEAVTYYRTLRGQRDRIVVFVTDGGGNSAQFAIGSPVTVVGTARTLLSLRVTNEVAWPARLDAQEIDELEVRGAVVDAAIVTAEGAAVAGKD
jgi:hypothetical protein